MPAPLVAVDVQHVYRSGLHARDRGSLYVLADGRKVTEAEAASAYASALAQRLRDRGLRVLTNDPATSTLVGPYSRRNRAAAAAGASLYLACHVNSGRGSYAALEMMAAHRNSSLCAWIMQRLVDVFPEILSARQVVLQHGDRGAVCLEAFPGPAILVEPFFGDNPRHQPLLEAPRLKALGECIGDQVARWFQSGPIHPE